MASVKMGTEHSPTTADMNTWMTRDELMEKYSQNDEIVDAILAHKELQRPVWSRPNPDAPTCVAARQYRVQGADIQTTTDRDYNDVNISANADLESKAATELMHAFPGASQGAVQGAYQAEAPPLV